MEEEKLNIASRVLNLYKRYGIKSITMDDIARELGLSKKTLYQYFNDKNDLVELVFEIEEKESLACFNEIFNKPQNAIEETMGIHRHVVEMLKKYNPSLDFDLKKYYPEIFITRRNRILQSMYEYQVLNLEKGKKEGLYRSDLNPINIARLFLLRIINIHDIPIFKPEEFMTPEFFRDVFIYHIRGVASDKGLTILEKEIKKLENKE